MISVEKPIYDGCYACWYRKELNKTTLEEQEAKDDEHATKRFKYKCPSCFLLSCSLDCVNFHKIITGCKGSRNSRKFDKIKISDYNEDKMWKDFHFLESARLAVLSSLKYNAALRTNGRNLHKSELLNQFSKKRKLSIFERNRLKKYFLSKDVVYESCPFKWMEDSKNNKSYYSCASNKSFLTVGAKIKKNEKNNNENIQDCILFEIPDDIRISDLITKSLRMFPEFRKYAQATDLSVKSTNNTEGVAEKIEQLTGIAVEHKLCSFVSVFYCIPRKRIDIYEDRKTIFVENLNQTLIELLKNNIVIEYPKFLVEIQLDPSDE